MRILILGVGDAFTRSHFGSSALIEAPRGYVLLDCPELVHRALAEATARAGWEVDALRVGDVILTHLHGDHCNGLESFGFMHLIARRRDAALPRPRLHTHRAAADRLWSRLAAAMDGADRDGRPTRGLEDFFDLRILEPGRIADVAGLSIECRATIHPVPCIGLLLSDGSRTLGWSGDTSFERAHVEWLSRADVIVHESNRGTPHTPIESLCALAPALRRKIRLIHLPDDFDPSTTDMSPLAEGEVL
jgi:ribonuclease BN (tRNA processing enzyme)